MVDTLSRRQLMVRWKCLACGTTARVPLSAERIVCVCDYVQLGGVRPGLGDWIAAILHRVGVTPARYVQVKRLLGLEASCRCPHRQHWLNTLGGRVVAWFQRMVAWFQRKGK